MYKIGGNRGKFINIVEIGEICYMHHWLIKGMDASGQDSITAGYKSLFMALGELHPPAKS